MLMRRSWGGQHGLACPVQSALASRTKGRGVAGGGHVELIGKAHSTSCKASIVYQVVQLDRSRRQHEKAS